MNAINRIQRAFALLVRAPLVTAIAWITLGSVQTAFAASPTAPSTTAALVAYAQQQALANGLDPSIFVRQIQEESGFNPSAHSASGAAGIAQIVPAGHPGVNPWDPNAAIAYMAQLDATYLRQFGRYDLMLAAYNAGPHVIAACQCVPPYAQTQKYVQDILSGSSTPSTVTIGSLAPSSAPASSPPTATSSPNALPAAQESAPARPDQRLHFDRGLRSGRGPSSRR